MNTTLRQNLRANVKDLAYLFSADSAAKDFQLKVPNVFAPTELFCKWFDDSYLPEDPEFREAFSKNEFEAVQALNTSLIKLSIEVGDPPPQLEFLFKMSSWAEVKQRAKLVLEALAIS